jgi:outer membrane immunogenic protein
MGGEGLIMKRIAIALLAGVTAIAGLGYSASAADLAVKALPPAPVLPSWTGFYIGVHAGAAWQSAQQWAFFDPNAPGDGVLSPLNLSGSPSLGAVGGIQGGYNWQFAPAWVVGVEGDISWASLGDHRSSVLFTAAGAPVPGSSVSMSANTQWLSSVRGKFGFTGWWNTMFYATGGVAWANTEYSAFVTNSATGTLQSNTSFNQTKSGWVIGGGAEWMATTNILLRAEYLYYSIDNGTTGSAAVFPPNAIVPAPFQYTWNKYNVQVARIAASYKF